MLTILAVFAAECCLVPTVITVLAAGSCLMLTVLAVFGAECYLVLTVLTVLAAASCLIMIWHWRNKSGEMGLFNW